MSKLTKLSYALIEATTERKSPEYHYEIMCAMAEEADANGYIEEAKSMWHSALTLTYMFRGFGADDEWERIKRTMPWHKRPFARMHSGFRKNWSDQQRCLGKIAVAQVLATDYTGTTATKKEEA